MTQVGAPAIGEILADRYRIEEHVNDDSTGRQVWRGVDVILQRAVTIVLRTPGGAEADEMLGAAVAASRVIHPNIVGVYDAIDEGSRAYVVREWVEGRALRDAVRESPLEPPHAIAVARAVADALSAVHATGVSHGNVHSGTVLLSVDDRVVLGDARANEQATAEGDVRAVGAILYCALTGYWPRHVPGPGVLPPAPIVDTGRLASPRQVRSGVPQALDQLTMDLLTPEVPAPGAAELAVELTRLGYHDHIGYPQPAYHGHGYGQSSYPPDGYAENGYPPGDSEGPLGFAAHLLPEEESRPVSRKVFVAVAGLLTIALAAVLLGTSWTALFGPGQDSPPSSASGGTDDTGNTSDGGNGAVGPEPLKITPDMIRMVDPPDGDRQEGDGIARAVDGDPATGWETAEYTSAKFGNLKPGMGILVDLGEPRKISGVNLTLSAPDATVGVRYGSEDFGDNSHGDERIAKEYEVAAEPTQVPSTARIPVDVETRYLLIWITKLPSLDGSYQIEVKEIQLVSGE